MSGNGGPILTVGRTVFEMWMGLKANALAPVLMVRQIRGAQVAGGRDPPDQPSHSSSLIRFSPFGIR